MAGVATCGGVVTQPDAAVRIATATPARSETQARRRSTAVMGWFFLEMLFALAAAVFIVWWTMGPKKRKPPRDS
jgi:urease accessory protein UreF